MKPPKKILLVEDDEFTRFMMAEIIETLDVPLVIAKNGQEGCAQLDTNPDDYGLVLMDIHMPKMSGIDATQVIRANPDDPPRSLPIIAVTADEKYHSNSIVAKHGMDGFIAKPVTTRELSGLIDKYCGSAQ